MTQGRTSKRIRKGLLKLVIQNMVEGQELASPARRTA
jgi:hypothetical protein